MKPFPQEGLDNGVLILKTPNKDGKIDYAGAYASFQTAIQGRPDFARAHFNAGWVAEAQGKLGKAAEHYGKASQLKPDNKKFLFAHGDLLSRSGNGDQAIALYRAYVEKDPEDLEALNALM